jgi:hypothetical protein
VPAGQQCDGVVVSWDEAFERDDDVWSAGVTADIPFYVGLARAASGTVVELAVGTGRVAIQWATKNEWLGLIDVSGLELESLHGDFTGQPLTDDRNEYVFTAHRREGKA